MELKPVYEVASSDGKTKDTVIEIETLQFSDGNMELNPEVTEKTSFDYKKLKMSTVKTHEGTGFGDKFIANSDIDIMTGGDWKDTFIFGSHPKWADSPKSKHKLKLSLLYSRIIT